MSPKSQDLAPSEDVQDAIARVEARLSTATGRHDLNALLAQAHKDRRHSPGIEATWKMWAVIISIIASTGSSLAWLVSRSLDLEHRLTVAETHAEDIRRIERTATKLTETVTALAVELAKRKP